MVAMVALALGSLANTAEISSNNIRSGAALDNIKATWNQALKLGDFSTNLQCNYDRNANKDFLSEATLSGDLVEASSADDVGVAYEVSHNFGDSKTNVKLSAKTQGTTLGAELDDREFTEISLNRDVEAGGQNVNVKPSWLLKSQTARVKLMTNVGDDNLRAQFDFKPDGAEVSGVEVSYDRSLESGRDVSVTFTPADKNMEVEYVDSKFEDGATWTATASVPFESAGGNLVDDAKVTLKRSWAW